jgi:hypothetical protein
MLHSVASDAGPWSRLSRQRQCATRKIVDSMVSCVARPLVHAPAQAARLMLI